MGKGVGELRGLLCRMQCGSPYNSVVYKITLLLARLCIYSGNHEFIENAVHLEA
jgi:hypothetical protein